MPLARDLKAGCNAASLPHALEGTWNAATPDSEWRRVIDPTLLIACERCSHAPDTPLS
jgi:hypothetical protein